MGRLPQEHRAYEIQKVQDRHRQIIRGVLIGKSNKAIAASLGITPQMVSYVRNSSLAKEQLGELHERADNITVDIASEIDKLQIPALELIDKIVRDEPLPTKGASLPVPLRMTAAFKALACGGNGPVTRVNANINANMGVFTRADLDDLRSRALPEARRRGLIPLEQASVARTEVGSLVGLDILEKKEEEGDDGGNGRDRQTSRADGGEDLGETSKDEEARVGEAYGG